MDSAAALKSSVYLFSSIRKFEIIYIVPVYLFSCIRKSL